MEEHREVLVVEDDADINALIGAYVSLAGFEYQSAMDGASALRVARERHPCLIVLDVMLPDTDGFQICAELKGDERTHDIPVVMLTALADQTSRKKGKDCGAVEYIAKPFDPDKFMETIQRVEPEATHQR